MAEQDTPPSGRGREYGHPDEQHRFAPPPDEARPSEGPRHALPEDMEPATGAAGAAHPAVVSARAARPRPAYEDYEAPESNLMPVTIAAIVGGILAAVLLLRLLHGRETDTAAGR